MVAEESQRMGERVAYYLAASEALDLAEREDKEKQKVCTYACMKTLI